MKQIVSYLVLLALLLVSVPREWVHDCEHSYAHHDDVDHESGSELSQDDCFACDYSLSSFSLHQFTDLQLGEYHHYRNSFAEVDASFADCRVIYSLRGPPQNELS